MQQRVLGKTGRKVSDIGFGAWAIGGGWGSVDDNRSMAALRAAADTGVTFIDTADVYGDGRSERLVARLLRERPDAGLFVATKAGRRLDPHVADGYNAANLEAFVDRSLSTLGVDVLDLLQLHCPPTEVYYRPEVFAALDDLAARGKLRNYGVSVEKVEEAIKAIEYPGVATVQIIFNPFRQRPRELFFDLAREGNVGIIVRVPLASGLLTGKMTASTSFSADDHRNFNRRGEAFDVGETFAGVDYETGLEAVARLDAVRPNGMTMAQMALRWILDHPAVSTAIPGAKTPQQAQQNAATSDLAPLPPAVNEVVDSTYAEMIEPLVHQRW